MLSVFCKREFVTFVQKMQQTRSISLPLPANCLFTAEEEEEEEETPAWMLFNMKECVRKNRSETLHRSTNKTFPKNADRDDMETAEEKTKTSRY